MLAGSAAPVSETWIGTSTVAPAKTCLGREKTRRTYTIDSQAADHPMKPSNSSEERLLAAYEEEVAALKNEIVRHYLSSQSALKAAEPLLAETVRLVVQEALKDKTFQQALVREIARALESDLRKDSAGVVTALGAELAAGWKAELGRIARDALRAALAEQLTPDKIAHAARLGLENGDAGREPRPQGGRSVRPWYRKPKLVGGLGLLFVALAACIFIALPISRPQVPETASAPSTGAAATSSAEMVPAKAAPETINKDAGREPVSLGKTWTALFNRRLGDGSLGTLPTTKLQERALRLADCLERLDRKRLRAEIAKARETRSRLTLGSLANPSCDLDPTAAVFAAQLAAREFAQSPPSGQGKTCLELERLAKNLHCDGKPGAATQKLLNAFLACAGYEDVFRLDGKPETTTREDYLFVAFLALHESNPE